MGLLVDCGSGLDSESSHTVSFEHSVAPYYFGDGAATLPRGCLCSGCCSHSSCSLLWPLDPLHPLGLPTTGPLHWLIDPWSWNTIPLVACMMLPMFYCFLGEVSLSQKVP